jgi:hypothetical protein
VLVEVRGTVVRLPEQLARQLIAQGQARAAQSDKETRAGS